MRFDHICSCVGDAGTKVDPTGTGGLRRRYERDMVGRFRKIEALIREAVVKLDVFGLRGRSSNVAKRVQNEMFARLFASAPAPAPKMTADAATAPAAQAFAFNSSGDKVAGFMSWLNSAERQDILEVSTGTPLSTASRTAWQNTYIDSAYVKGLRDAGEQLTRSGVSNLGVGVFNQPIHADRVGIIYTRAYRELEGITAEMDRQISRTLAQAMAEGRGLGAGLGYDPATGTIAPGGIVGAPGGGYRRAYELAQELTDRVERIGITRARTLVRTEVINAHAEAALNLYEQAGVEGVSADVEFLATNDNVVCPECQDLDGKTFTIDEARGVIPVHPNCRCSWAPVVN